MGQKNLKTEEENISLLTPDLKGMAKSSTVRQPRFIAETMGET
jgi:hypothetical protein